jgi:hypothetical protein
MYALAGGKKRCEYGLTNASAMHSISQTGRLFSQLRNHVAVVVASVSPCSAGLGNPRTLLSLSGYVRGRSSNEDIVCSDLCVPCQQQTICACGIRCSPPSRRRFDDLVGGPLFRVVCSLDFTERTGEGKRGEVRSPSRWSLGFAHSPRSQIVRPHIADQSLEIAATCKPQVSVQTGEYLCLRRACGFESDVSGRSCKYT